MKNLTISQEYTLCVLHKEKKEKGELYEGKYAGCIILAGFLELLLTEKIALDEERKVIIKDSNDSDREYLNIIYSDISNEKPKTLKKWLEHYLAGYSNKPTKRIVSAVISSLEEIKCVSLEKKNGFIKDTTLFNTDEHQVNCIVEKLKAELLEKGEMMYETVIIASLLLQSGLLMDYFSKHETEQLKLRIEEIKKNSTWENVTLIKQIIDELDTVLIITVIAGIV